MVRTLLVVVVLAAACKGDKPAADCAAVAEVMFSKALASRAKDLENPRVAAKVAEAVAPIKTAMTARCRDDGWSAAARACMAASADDAAFKACERKHLTVEQQANAKDALDGFDEPPSRDKVNKMLARMTTFKERMCACTDQACADAVSAELAAFGKESSDQGLADLKAGRAPDKMNDEEIARSKTISDELAACAVKASAGSAAPPP
ncbi:MAG: hypothetical protein KA297_22200 [Kofleriaceae bacterium]|nr:hypothetical protein [Kofleriaceae bacterium]MBP6836429.1 hypothetical protein [Kofleriaceae bacterium]